VKKRLLKIAKIVGICFAVILVLFLVLIGPWPTYSAHYAGKPYYEETLQRIDTGTGGIHISSDPGKLTAGYAKADITPPVGTPLAGYGHRRGAPSTSVLDRLYVKALALSDGQDTVVVVGSDMLLVHEDMVKAIYPRVLEAVDIPRHCILFNASHTHSGPGAWGKGIGEKITGGDYDQKIFDMIVEGFSNVIIESVNNKHPASLGLGVVECPAYIRNRVVKSGKIDPWLSYMFIELADTGETLVYANYSAHPTTLSGMEISADFPGFVQKYLEANGAVFALYQSGGVGSMGPRTPKPGGYEGVRAMGEGLAKKILEQRPKTKLSNRVEIAAIGCEVMLPPFQVRLPLWFPHLRLSPILTSLVTDRDGYLQAALVDNTIFMGAPADLGGEIDLVLKDYVREKGYTGVTFSFCGDYVGYIVPDERYMLYEYETSLMSMNGPYMGSYFTELMERMVDRIDSRKRAEAGGTA